MPVSLAGIQMEAGEMFVPVVQVSVTAACGRSQARPGPRMGRGDIVTEHGGMVPDNPKYRLDRWTRTRLVMDAISCHVYTSRDHGFKKILSNIGSIQRIENTDQLIIEQGSPLLL